MRILGISYWLSRSFPLLVSIHREIMKEVNRIRATVCIKVVTSAYSRTTCSISFYDDTDVYYSRDGCASNSESDE
jgi:hypothetical protein